MLVSRDAYARTRWEPRGAYGKLKQNRQGIGTENVLRNARENTRGKAYGCKRVRCEKTRGERLAHGAGYRRAHRGLGKNGGTLTERNETPWGYTDNVKGNARGISTKERILC